jgi:hypothetical protein
LTGRSDGERHGARVRRLREEVNWGCLVNRTSFVFKPMLGN